MGDYRLSGPAERKIQQILAASERDFGTLARERYAALLVKAMEDLAEEPSRSGVEHYRGLDRKLGTYHIRYSRKRVSNPPGSVKNPRHLIVFQAGEDGIVDVLGVLHDHMLPRRALRKILSQTAP